MKLVMVGDNACLQALPVADGHAPCALPGAAEAIAQLGRHDIAVAMAAHWIGDSAAATLRRHAQFLRELDALGTHLDAIFFWPEPGTDAGELLRTAGQRYGIDPHAMDAAFADDAPLAAAAAAGCRVHRIGPAPAGGRAPANLPAYANLAAFASILTARATAQPPQPAAAPATPDSARP